MTRAERDRPAALAASKASQAAIKRVNAQAGHTPGPWRAERTGPWDGWDGWEVIAKDGATVCNGLGSQRDPIREANALLIAAAPEMLAALKAIVDCAGPGAGPEIGLALDAIQKATGDTP